MSGHMASHVKIHVFTRDMASHVSTCMDVKLCINRRVHRRMREKSRKGKEKWGKRDKEKGEKKKRK